MDSLARTGFSRFLANAQTAHGIAQVAQTWVDQTVRYRLAGGRGVASAALGGHLRRSFLGALGRGASSEAQQNQPCPWDPPCALDVFLREQFRDARGNGLPKPYVIFTEIEGDDLSVSLRVFGAANDWFAVAAESLAAGMRDILPWQRLFGRAMPPIADRTQAMLTGVPVPLAGDRIALEFVTPVDADPNAHDIEHSLLARLLRRTEGLAHWQGLALAPDEGRRLAGLIHGLDCRDSRLMAGAYLSPNRQAQHRRHTTLTGQLVALGEIADILPLLAIGERCHLGRAAVEGLGRYRIATRGGD